MNKLEKDILTLMMINDYIKPSTLGEFIDNFDREKATEIFQSSKFLNDKKSSMDAISKIAKESYDRIIKKTT